MRLLRNGMLALVLGMALATPLLLLLYWAVGSQLFSLDLHFSEWQPRVEQLFLTSASYSLPQLMVGFLAIALLAAILAAPLALLAALFLGEFIPFQWRDFLSNFLQISSAVPLTIIGLGFFGLFLPMLPSELSFLGGIFFAGVLSALMLLPILTARFLEAFRRVPNNLVETAYVVGATPWQVSYLVLLPHARFDLMASFSTSASRLIAELILLSIIADFGLSMAPAIWTLSIFIALLYGLAIWLRQRSRNQILRL